jgi:hypothetical protein
LGKQKTHNECCEFPFAEKEGFEPPDLLQSTVFKTAAFDHSAISPVVLFFYDIAGANIEKRFSFCKNISTFFNRIILKSIYFFWGLLKKIININSE